LSDTFFKTDYNADWVTIENKALPLHIILGKEGS
jgi:hypothetical protein